MTRDAAHLGRRRRRLVAQVEALGAGGVSARELLEPQRAPLLLEEPAGGAEPGDIVMVEETDESGSRGRLLGSLLARAGSIRGELYRLAARHGLDPVHPVAVMAEAKALAGQPGIDDPGLADLTGLDLVTIDGARSRDLDQAVHVRRMGDGWEITYALADAAHFVRPGRPLLEEALRRGASFYLPGLNLPMLPRLLSEGVVSLNPGVARRAVVLVMRVDRRGHCQNTRLLRARVRSRAKLSFRRVQRFYDDSAGSPLSDAAYRASLEALREVGECLEGAARRRHVVRYHRRESEVELGEGERAGFVVVGDQRLPVERYNEQVSLLCNVEGARLLAGAGGEQVQAVFKVHPAPTTSQLGELADRIDALVAARGLDPERWRWRRDPDSVVPGEPLADYLQRLPRRGRGGGAVRAVERQAMLLNRRASFEAAPAPHYGIGAPVYARFSSPMREVVGIYTHKEALELLGLETAAADADDGELRERVIAAGNRAKEIQRQLTKDANRMVLDRIFRSELERPPAERPHHIATVLGLDGSRLYVQLERPVLDLKVYVRDLEAQLGTELHPDGHSVALYGDGASEPAVTLGDRLTLTVERFDEDRDRWVFQVR